MKNNYLFKFSFLILLHSLCSIIIAQTTYTWNVAAGNFLTPSSWTPSRNTPAINDILVFNGTIQATPTVNNIRTQQIGRLRIINGANVNFASAIADTGIGKINLEKLSSAGVGLSSSFINQLKMGDIIYDSTFYYHYIVQQIVDDTLIYCGAIYNSGGIGNDYNSFFIQPKLLFKQTNTSTPSIEIATDSKLRFTCKYPSLSIIIDTGTYANINGTLSFGDSIDVLPSTTNLSLSKIYIADSNGMRIKNGGLINCFYNQALGFLNNPYKSNMAVFDSGSVFKIFSIFNTGFDYSYTQPAVKFLSGSTYILNIPNNWSVSLYFENINFSNIICRNYTSNLTSRIFLKNCSAENIQIDTGFFNFEITGELLIKKDITIKPAAILEFKSNNGLNQKCIFKGNTLQKINGIGTLLFNGDKTNTLDVVLSNKQGFQLNNHIQVVNCNLKLDSGALDLNNHNITIGKDSSNIGNILAKDGYLFGSGKLIKWYPSNNTVTSNIDSTYFPFGTSVGKRTFWVTGNVSKSGTVSLSYSNNLGMVNLLSPFTDNNITINKRQKYSWHVLADNGLSGNNFTVKAMGQLDSGYTNLPTTVRLTLANNKAPGSALNGAGTALLPLATRTNLNDSNLNNTYYLGSYSTLCTVPFAPIITNKTICNNNNSTLSTIGDGIISWYTDSIGGNYLGVGVSYVTPTLTHSINYYVQDSTCAASPRTKVSVFVLAKPLIGFTINNSSQCVNANNFIFTDTSAIVQDGFSRLWKISNTDTSTSINFTKKFNAVGNYAVQLFITNNLNNSCKDSITKTIIVKPKPIVFTTTTDSVICQGNGVTLNGSGAKTYSWSDSVMNGIAFFPFVNKTYRVIGIDSNNCADTATIFIKVNQKPIVLALASANQVCAKNTIVLTGSGADQYIWSDSVLNGVPFIPIASKTYVLTALDTNGCSNTSSIYIIVKTLPNNTVTKNKTMITATQTGVIYQWLNCNTAKSVIVGAINQSYTALANGNYAVIITQNGCSDTSICINVNSVNVSEVNALNKISLYPNPATNLLTITSETAIKEVFVYDLVGKLVKQMNIVNTNTKETEISIDELTAGIYIIQVIDVFDAKLNSKFIKE